MARARLPQITNWGHGPDDAVWVEVSYRPGRLVIGAVSGDEWPEADRALRRDAAVWNAAVRRIESLRDSARHARAEFGAGPAALRVTVPNFLVLDYCWPWGVSIELDMPLRVVPTPDVLLYLPLLATIVRVCQRAEAEPDMEGS